MGSVRSVGFSDVLVWVTYAGMAAADIGTLVTLGTQ
jgi:hypothetical protein